MVLHLSKIVRKNMIRPAYLKKGDKVGIVAPARFVAASDLAISLDVLSNWGYEVVLSEYLTEQYHQFAGTDIQRAKSVQKLIDDPNIRAIFFARGGYGCLRTLMLLNWEKFLQSPKWLVGYSDITVFHSYVTQVLGVETIHGPMPIKFSELSDTVLYRLRNALEGTPFSYKFESHALNKIGVAKGNLIGGNLSILYSLRGTEADVKPTNSILFIEDLDEYLYHIDRMMMNLRYSGILKSLSGVLVGGMSDMHDNKIPFGFNAEEIIAASMHDMDIPLVFGFSAGHIQENLPIYLGREAILESKLHEVVLRYE